MQFTYGVYFTQGLFRPDNPVLADLLRQQHGPAKTKLLFAVDKGVAQAHPSLLEDIAAYTTHHAADLQLAAAPMVVPGGRRPKTIPASWLPAMGVMEPVMEWQPRTIAEDAMFHAIYALAVGLTADALVNWSENLYPTE